MEKVPKTKGKEKELKEGRSHNVPCIMVGEVTVFDLC